MIRSQPKGLPRGVAGASAWIVSVAQIWRLIRREKAWIVQVRAREQDPFGEVLHEEEALGGREARQRVEALGRELRSGKPPWEVGEGA